MSREMKNSGIDWIGDIPQKWKIENLQWNMTEIIEKNSPIKMTSVLSLTKEKGIIPYEDKGNQGNKSKESIEEYKIAYKDTIVANSMNVLIGSVGISDYDGCVSPVYYVFKNTEKTDLRFLNYIFSTEQFQKQLRKYANGILEIRLRVSSESIMKQKVMFPPLTEQKQIVAFLDSKVSEIDKIIFKTKESIESYKEYKQAIITETVTKGLDKNVPMKDSGIWWIGDIPVNWEINKNKYVAIFSPFCDISKLNEKSEITYTPMEYIKNGFFINNTISLGSVASSLTPYQNGDIVMAKVTPCFENGNIAIMENLSSGFGMGSSELFVFRPQKIQTAFMFYWLRNSLFSQRATSTMTGTGGLKRVSSYFVCNDFILLPPENEQSKIVEYLDEKCKEIDHIISSKEELIANLEEYKKSLIYEYVTGKKELSPSKNESAMFAIPVFPATYNATSKRFAQAVLISKILDTSNNNKGRVKLEKTLYIIEHHLGFDFETEYTRDAAGPLDNSIYNCETIISRKNKWFSINTNKYGVSYKPEKDVQKYKRYFNNYFSDYNAEIERIIRIFDNFTTEQAEIVATLYGAWNDFIIDNKVFTDEDVADDVLNNWHDSKKRFNRDIWLRAMKKMRTLDLIPKGYGKKTVMKEEHNG